MKKYIFLLLAACQGLATMAQENVAYKLKVNLASGEKLAFRADEVDSITFANYEKVQVNLSKALRDLNDDKPLTSTCKKTQSASMPFACRLISRSPKTK